MRVLFINDDSILNPIIHSQGLPQLSYLAGKGHEIYFLSFENRDSSVATRAMEKIIDEYRKITFIVVRPIMRAVFSRKQLLVVRPLVTLYYVRKLRINCIHARSYMPAFVGLLAKYIFNVKLIFDMRGLMIDELISQGLRKRNSYAVRLMRILEQAAIIHSDAIVVVSNKFADYVKSLDFMKNLDHEKIHTIYNAPPWERLNNQNDEEQIVKFRAQFRDKKIIVYSGSLALWQGVNEVIHFFQKLRLHYANVVLMILTYDSLEKLKQIVAGNHLTESHYVALNLPFEKVPAYLSISDLALIIRKDELLNNVSCPLKFAEYLMAGVPVGVTKGIGDTVEIVTERNIGAIIDLSSEKTIQESILRTVRILEQDRGDLRAKCQNVARELFSFDLAVTKYENIYTSMT